MKEKIYTLTDEGPIEGAPESLSEEGRIDTLLHDGTRLVLKHLGVDLSGDVNLQLEDKQIILEDCRDEKNPLARGVYILQKQEKVVLPIAFVGNVRSMEIRCKPTSSCSQVRNWRVDHEDQTRPRNEGIKKPLSRCKVEVLLCPT